jgi:chromosome segregation ATPase
MTTELQEIAEMRGELSGLTTRVGTLETRVDSGFDRLEQLFKQEINDLKQEQLSDAKREITRLGDDQRRIWDELHSQSRLMTQRDAQREARHESQKEAKETIFNMGNLIALLFGGVLTAIATWLLGGHHPL